MADDKNKLDLIEKQIEEIIKTQNEETLTWNKIKIKMLQNGDSTETIEEHRSKYITIDLKHELKKLKLQRNYYNNKTAHQEYYQKHREAIIAKSRQTKSKKAQ